MSERRRAAVSVEAAPRSLADGLRGWADEDLVELLRARPDLVHPVPSDLAGLAARAGSVPSVARALDRLDRFHLDVLEAVAVLPEPVSTDAVASGLPHDAAEAVEAALTRCRRLALVFGPDEDLRLVRTAVEQLGPAPAGLGPALAPAHQRLAAALARGLDPLLAGAPDGAREALDHLVWGPPNGRVDNARRRVPDADEARSPVEWLLAQELLVPVSADTVVLPREVALHLRGGVVHREPRAEPPPLGTSEVPPDQVDRAAAGQAFTAVRLTEALLELWGGEPPPVLRAGGLGVRDLRRTATALDVDERTAAVLLEAAYAAGLLARDDEVDEAFAPTPAYDLWLTRDAADRWVALAGAWLDVPRVSGPVGSREGRDKAVAALSSDLERPSASHVRRSALGVLGAAGPGRAVGMEQVAGRLDWLQPRRAGRRRTEEVGWALEEAATLGLTGRGALSEHGRQLLAGRDEEALELLDPLLPDPLDHVLLQADLTAVAPGPLESALAAELSLMADVESTGGATVYRFTPSSVRRALDAGRTASELHALLATRSRTPVPQPLTYLVDDVARRHGQIRVGTASAYVRCDDEGTLTALVADRRAGALRLRRLAPTVVVAQAPVDQVLAGLRDLGYAPAAEAADGTVMVRRPDHRRTPPRQRPPRVTTEPAVLSDPLLAAAVRALRAGDRASSAPRGRTVSAALGGVLPRSTTAETLGALRAAVESGHQLWIGYVDTHGGVTERVVDPVRLANGYLTAFDHRLEEMHTFAVHRITGVATLEDEDGGGPGDNGGSTPDPEGIA